MSLPNLEVKVEPRVNSFSNTPVLTPVSVNVTVVVTAAPAVDVWVCVTVNVSAVALSTFKPLLLLVQFTIGRQDPTLVLQLNPNRLGIIIGLGKHQLLRKEIIEVGNLETQLVFPWYHIDCKALVVML